MAAEPVQESAAEAGESRSTRAKDLFLAAADLPARERATYLDRQCAGDADLRLRVEALLKAHDLPGSFPGGGPPPIMATLDSRPGEGAGGSKNGGAKLGEAAFDATRALGSREETIGASIGPYKLLQKLGEGGMGMVYMAEQSQPVRRMVALKIIREGMDSRQVVARFEAERQALAMMEHPNIARVLDAGTTESGRPFFAMELVKGIPITRFCDEQHLTPRERLKLFIPVCQAVQHAHQKGIIHRDLKPSNVLVALYDDRPVPKVIDFGVAKATSQKLTERTMFTEFGSVVGTLEYMSPEQAKFNALDVDTRSDIYALGVMLYELLTGTTPIERKRLKDSALDELLRVIREEEPPLPSTRLSQSRELLPSVAAQRHTEPARLAKLLRGDLDWIVMKALEKDRSRRYDTASSLAHDIERYLDQKPVEACPPSTAYRLRKFFRRNRGAVIAAGLLLLALVGGIAGTTLGLIKAQNALTAEANQRDIAEKAAIEKEKARAAAATERDQKEQARAAAEKALYFNRIHLAQQYWQNNNLAQSRRILDAISEELPVTSCGWEWRFLDRLHHGGLATLPTESPDTTGLSLSKDGSRLAAFSPLGPVGVTVWDLNANKKLIDIRPPSGNRRFTCATLSPDGRTVAVGEQSGAVTLWNVATGKQSRDFAKLSHSISTLSFSPDGRWLAAGRADDRGGEMLMPWLEPSRNEELAVWETESGHEVFHPKGYGYIAQFSPSGSRLLTFKKNPALRTTTNTPESLVALFDTATWTEVAPGALGSASCYAFSRNGKWLALGGFDRLKNTHFVRVVNQATGDELASIAPNVPNLNFDVAVDSDGSTLAVTEGINYGEIEVWNVRKGLRTGTLRGHLETVNSIVFAAGDRLVSCSWDMTIKVWNPSLPQELRVVGRPVAFDINPAVITAGGNLLAFSERGAVNIMTGPVQAITLVDLAAGMKPAPAEGGMLDAVGRAIFNPATPNEPSRFLGGNFQGTMLLAASGDGKRLLSAGRNGDIALWDLKTDQRLFDTDIQPGAVTAIALGTDGTLAASARDPAALTAARLGKGPWPAGNSPIDVTIWEAATGKLRFSLPGHTNHVSALAFSPDGRWLATVAGRTVRIFDAATGKLSRELDRDNLSEATELVFSPSGNLLAAAGNEAVQLWQTADGKPAGVFQGHRGTVTVAFSPDESRLATAAGREVKLWDIASGQEALTLPLVALKPDDRAPPVAVLMFSPDGQRLRAALRDGSVVEWDATPLGR